ncbi:MAG: 23S rRNA (guanosine(2251)-2'-O)-methyltransferase RlmB [Geminicoccaceae bacterium]|nr:23S rRNA (guanosine(2251)-2'-O)-methyltransferase RlmB [Geminicoccaceae bacterium]
MRAALLNPRRTLHQLMATAEGLERLGSAGRRAGLRIVPAGNEEIARFVPDDAQHQGVALQTAPLPPVLLERLVAVQPEAGLLLVLDQITDPRNFGAILRSAAALGVGGVVVPERRSAELGGAAAKAASGALDLVPVAEVVNLARALGQLQAAGYWITGLDGAAGRTLADSGPTRRRAVVMGSEGTGLRRLVGAACDELVRIPIEPRMESLNVSVAAGIALYELAGIDRRGR